MEAEMLVVGEHAINLKALASAHWENEKLFVHLLGGRFLQLVGKDAQSLWESICVSALRPEPRRAAVA